MVVLKLPFPTTKWIKMGNYEISLITGNKVTFEEELNEFLEEFVGDDEFVDIKFTETGSEDTLFYSALIIIKKKVS